MADRLTIVPPRVEDYLLKAAAQRHPALKRMEALAEKIRYDVGGGRSIAFPIVGPLVGALLAHYATLIGAKRVFELGSGYGYSAFWFAQAVGPSGRVVCTEGREENRRTALRFLRGAGLARRVDFRLGDGLTILRRERGPFDVVFVDMEKTRYPLAVAPALARLRRGGLLIADNVLWSGRVLDRAADASTRALRKFTRLVTRSRRFRTVILPIRDGVSVSVKISDK